MHQTMMHAIKSVLLTKGVHFTPGDIAPQIVKQILNGKHLDNKTIQVFFFTLIFIIRYYNIHQS